MNIRTFREGDRGPVVGLTIEAFRPFLEGDAPLMLGEDLFQLLHGHWQQDYRDLVPRLHDPDGEKWAAVSEVAGVIAGFVAWQREDAADQGRISLLAVRSEQRRQQIGRALCSHALAHMQSLGIGVVGVGTGGVDPFHEPARGLYESLGFTKVLVAQYVMRI